MGTRLPLAGSLALALLGSAARAQAPVFIDQHGRPVTSGVPYAQAMDLWNRMAPDIDPETESAVDREVLGRGAWLHRQNAKRADELWARNTKRANELWARNQKRFERLHAPTRRPGTNAGAVRAFQPPPPGGASGGGSMIVITGSSEEELVTGITAAGGRAASPAGPLLGLAAPTALPGSVTPPALSPVPSLPALGTLAQ